MTLSVVLPSSHGVVLRARFFRSHGVALESPSRSSSGVREEDGMVMFAMPVKRVRVDAWGCSCLLWAPRNRFVHDALTLEVLRHCKLAAQHGAAEGFLLGEDQAPVEGQELLALRVVKVDAEYWARWGSAVRAEHSRRRASSRGERFP